MAHRRPSRKKKMFQLKPAKFHPLDRLVRNRIVRRQVQRKKKKEGYLERKVTLYVVGGFILAFAIMILLYIITRAHEELEHP